MALADLLQLSDSSRKVGLSEERVQAIVPVLRQYIAFWREYPDIFVDFMVHGFDEERMKRKDNFHFFFYQRLFLRASMRYKYTYFVFPRAQARVVMVTLLKNLSNCGELLNKDNPQPSFYLLLIEEGSTTREKSRTQ